MKKYQFRIKTYISCLLINLVLIILTYFVAPQLMNWPPHSQNADFQQAVGTISHTAQFTLAYFIFSLIVIIFVNIQYKNIFRLYEGKEIKTTMHEVRQKSFSIANKLMIVLASCVFLVALIVVIVIPHSIEAAIKMLIMYSIIGITGAVIIDFVLSPNLKKFIDWSSHRDENYVFNYKKKSFRKMLFLKITPLIILSIVFVSFFGYAKIIKENGYNNFKHYRNELSNINFNGLNTEQIIIKLKDMQKLDENYDFFFIQTSKDNFITEDNRKMSLFFKEYINFYASETNGRIYDSYGIERGGYVKAVTIDTGEKIYIGFNFTTSDTEIFIVYLTLFGLLIIFAITYLYVFINNVTTDINTISTNLKKIASNEQNSLIEKISIPSNDEIGEIIASYNKIQDLNSNYIYQLNIATKQAERANKAKTDFLASMSHEIRTPLNAIVGFSQALSEENISGEAKEEVNDIIMASNNLLEIVNGILDISKIEANKLEIVNTEYDAHKLMKDVIALTKARMASKPLDFKINIDQSMPEVLYGDYTRVKQIMINILTNAVKYTKEGYIDLTINTLIKDDICRLIISVEDSGIGIKPEDVDKLFTKFQRFELEKNITTEGTGLGLAITKSLIELMGGKIVVQSKYGKGSKFTISLDQRIVAKTAEALESEYDDDTTPFNATGQRIMVVDDNKVNLKVAKRLLRDYNAEVILVLSGQDCLNLILNGDKFDLILMDDMMPRMTGTEVLKHLKNIIGFNTPIVALTANAISGMRERYLSLGFDDYLAKPIDRDKMHFILRRYLNETGEYIANKVPLEDTQEININLITDNIVIRNTEFLEANGIDLSKGLELLGDMETYEMTLEDFYEESKSRLEQLNSYKEKNDMENYAILVHAMKSDSKYLGFTKLAELSFNHEMSSKEKNIQYIDENYNELTDEASRIMSIVKKYLGK